MQASAVVPVESRADGRHVSAVTRERLRRFMRISRMAAVIGAGVGALYGSAIAGPGGLDGVRRRCHD